MKHLLVIAMIAAILTGCTWAEVEKGATGVSSGAEKVELVSTAVGPYTQGYGGLVAALSSAVSVGALALARFAKKKKDQVAQAAVEAANETDGGGQALVNAAVSNGVAGDIRKIYNAVK